MSRELAEQHYIHLKDKPFFPDLLNYIQGKMYGEAYQRVLAMVYRGENAIQKVRDIAGIHQSGRSGLHLDPRGLWAHHHQRRF